MQYFSDRNEFLQKNAAELHKYALWCGIKCIYGAEIAEIMEIVHDFYISRLPKVLSSYSPDKGTFATYYRKCLTYHLWRHSKLNQKRLASSYGETIDCDLQGASDPEYENFECRQALQRFMAHLRSRYSDKEYQSRRKFLLLLSEHPQKELADILKITKQRVSQIRISLVLEYKAFMNETL